jgi:hypothetical protein
VSDYYGKTIGIALKSGIAGDLIQVQTSGRVVSSNYSFTNVGSYIYARTAGLYEYIEPTISENMVIKLGVIDSPSSFILNIRDFPFQSIIPKS